MLGGGRHSLQRHGERRLRHAVDARHRRPPVHLAPAVHLGQLVPQHAASIAAAVGAAAAGSIIISVGVD